MKYNHENSIEEKEIDNEKNEKEKEIMEKIKVIANSIYESIFVKVDYPSNHPNKRLLILDTEMWIEEIDVNGTPKHQILYSYYEKEMLSKYLIHKVCSFKPIENQHLNKWSCESDEEYIFTS